MGRLRDVLLPNGYSPAGQRANGAQRARLCCLGTACRGAGARAIRGRTGAQSGRKRPTTATRGPTRCGPGAGGLGALFAGGDRPGDRVRRA
ncbi:hypothetical protein AL035_15550 [Salipiger aestuarii]|nr:hypothetical protein AL035_15550 [Salipiger aestuarii]